MQALLFCLFLVPWLLRWRLCLRVRAFALGRWGVGGRFRQSRDNGSRLRLLQAYWVSRATRQDYYTIAELEKSG
ncbi:hypothetical protein BDR22DRAFT_841886 [Usnea florida]